MHRGNAVWPSFVACTEAPLSVHPPLHAQRQRCLPILRCMHRGTTACRMLHCRYQPGEAFLAQLFDATLPLLTTGTLGLQVGGRASGSICAQHEEARFQKHTALCMLGRRVRMCFP